MNILVVDDDADVRESLRAILERAGYTVAMQGSAEDALEYIINNEVSFLLLDFSLPGMSGQQMIRIMKDKGIYVPTLLLTALAPWQALGMIAEGVGYIRKPVEADLLLDSIKSIMRKQERALA